MFGFGGTRRLAEGAELTLDRVAGEVRVDLVEALALQGEADLVDIGTSARAGESEGAFEGGNIVHFAPMAHLALETKFRMAMLQCNKVSPPLV